MFISPNTVNQSQIYKFVFSNSYL